MSPHENDVVLLELKTLLIPTRHPHAFHYRSCMYRGIYAIYFSDTKKEASTLSPAVLFPFQSLYEAQV